MTKHIIPTLACCHYLMYGHNAVTGFIWKQGNKYTNTVIIDTNELVGILAKTYSINYNKKHPITGVIKRTNKLYWRSAEPNGGQHMSTTWTYSWGAELLAQVIPDGWLQPVDSSTDQLTEETTANSSAIPTLSGHSSHHTLVVCDSSVHLSPG